MSDHTARVLLPAPVKITPCPGKLPVRKLTSVSIAPEFNMVVPELKRLFKALAMPMEFVSAEADIEIIEKHHNQKIDAPSGTALMIADAIRTVRTDAELKKGRSGQVYCLGSGIVQPLKDYIQIIGKVVDDKIPLGIGEIPHASNHIMAVPFKGCCRSSN